MRRLTFTLVMLVALIFVPVAAHTQGSPIFGSAVILYSVNEDALKAVDPLNIRMVVNRFCPHEKKFGKGRSVEEIFKNITEGLPKKERVILQVALLFDEDDAVCVAFWFAYTEK